jgi:hypothetical protein
MPRRILAMLLVLVTLAAAAAAQSGGRSGSAAGAEAANPQVDRGFEMLMEGGLALPTGNLGAEFLSEDAALGAEPGFLLGLRARIYLSRSFSVAPAFSYTEFGDYDGRDSNDEVFTIVARVLRYGLDFVYIKPGRHKQVRPFVGAGAALVRNKYRENYVEAETYYADGLNAFAWSLLAGLRWRDWELSAAYELNTFSTARFLPTGVAVDYDWSQLSLRLAFALPQI